MAVPKKRTSLSKNVFVEIFGRKRDILLQIKLFSLAKSVSVGNSKSFFVRQTSKKNWSNLKFYGLNNSQFLKMQNFH